MGHRHWHGCGPRGQFSFSIPEALMAMRGTGGGRGWSGNWGPFDFDFGDGPPGRGRGRKRQRMFGSGELRLLLLKLIADEPRHGYDLIRAVEELTFGDYAPSPGVIYPTLTLLQDMGLIEEAQAEGPRKPFQVTDEGRKHLEEKADEVEALFDRLEEEFAPHERRGGGPPIGRAVGNLMNALSHRVSREGLNEELLHEIATILDEAAQRIERVK
jgi:DNA-binding PadR family transcriptional regulator